MTICRLAENSCKNELIIISYYNQYVVHLYILFFNTSAVISLFYFTVISFLANFKCFDIHSKILFLVAAATYIILKFIIGTKSLVHQQWHSCCLIKFNLYLYWFHQFTIFSLSRRNYTYIVFLLQTSSTI